MGLYDPSLPTTPYNSVNAGVIPPDVFGIAINWFVNRTPLTARLPKAPVGSLSFKITNDAYRPRSTTTGASALISDTTITVADATMFDVGDVLQIGSEFLLVTAIASTTTLTVTRGYAGTSAAALTNAEAIYLITNTRTGSEVDISALSRVPVVVTQDVQTIQHAYQVGGSLQSATNYVSGYGTPLQRDKMLTVQHCMDDFESAIYYGKDVPLAASSTKPMMKGLKTLISTNLTTSPTNASAYKPSDLVRDTIQKCYNAGGQPGAMIVSTDFLSGLSIWGNYNLRVPAGETNFGVPIEMFSVSFLPGIPFIPAPLLRAGTAICLSLPEVRIRMKRNLFEKPRGSRGDAEEGDFIMEGAIELDNESHHAWVEGITTFSAT
jgi:hypothetical protein